MRKSFSLLLVFVMVFSLLTGCAGQSSSTEGGAAESTGQTVVLYQNKVEIGEPLAAFAQKYTAETGVEVKIKTSGGDSPYGQALKAEFQSDTQPDIFVIEGPSGYDTWKEKIGSFDGDAWIDLTDYEFTVDDKVIGFPVAVEAWGMIYNKEILDKAGIDPATLTSQEAYADAFAKLDGMKDELGISAPVSMGAGPDMRWVTGLHNFNGYLSSGLAYDDSSVIDKLKNGEVDEQRLTEYADWVELLFNYADEAVLLTGNYDAQVGLFATGKSAFLHQGNWIDPWLLENGVKFEMGFAPHAPVKGEMDSIFIGPPSWYVLNKESKNLDAAKAFLNYLATNEAGHDYMVNQAQMVAAFSNVSLKPSAPLSAETSKWLQEGKSYAWWQNDMPDNFGMGELGPIYESFAKGDIDKQGFIDQIKAKIEGIK